MKWTQDKLDELAVLFNKGYSFSRIGQALGTSRNSVAGVCKRLGLKSSDRGSAKYVQVQKTVRKPPVRPVRPVAPESPRIPDAPYTGVEAVVNLGPGECKWPIGDIREKGFRFCCAEIVGSTSYCPHHSSIAFSPQLPRHR